MTLTVTIESRGAKLEGILSEGASRRAVVVCHPHPMYGGNMNNPVVMTISETFLQRGFATLRFNFRGAGNSTGQFDKGVGEVEDVRAALLHVLESGYEEIWLAGYSFGARINAQMMSEGRHNPDFRIKDHIMISPPAAFMSFDPVRSLPGTGLVVTGEDDEIAPWSLIEKDLQRWEISPRVEVIENCDHFYSGCLEKLSAILADYIG